jgi:hypothetical protein
VVVVVVVAFLGVYLPADCGGVGVFVAQELGALVRKSPFTIGAFVYTMICVF